MTKPLKFSIIIANYNYARFVSEAIESALAQDWPHFEIIVVDDGSTDDSRERISAYKDRVRAIFQSNSGQRVANNVGFAASSGDAVIFLDADDLLAPTMLSEIAAIWSEQTSKVQAMMMRVDEHGRALGSTLPALHLAPSPSDIRRWANSGAEYPSPPGSGNAYARSFLEKIFPIDADRDGFTDSTCIAMAPFFGDIHTITTPLVYYRIHGANDSNLLRDDRNFGREVARAIKRLKASQDACEMQGLRPPPLSSLFRGTHLLQLRVASLRLRPTEHPLTNDSRARAFADALTVPFRSGFEPLVRRILIAAWSMIAVVSPQPLARAMIRRRFTPRRAP